MESPLDTDQEIFCSLLSQDAGEQLFGTAGLAEVYLLLEYSSAWGAKALPESDLPGAVKSHLEAAAASLSPAKVLLIKSRPGVLEPGIRFFVAVTRENNPALHSFVLERYEELLAINIPAVAAGDRTYLAHRSEERLYLVCTNGRRDICCAKFGFPVYVGLLKTAGDSAWQCTHLGGHRFATNVLCLPHGILYGRLQESDIANFSAACEQERIDLDHYRGRTCYPQPIQAAEYYIRRQTGELRLEALRLHDFEQTGDAQWRVRFRSEETGQLLPLCIHAETTDRMIYQSCRLDERAPMIVHHLC